MACPAVATGRTFLSSALVHVDCQARVIGSYGWAALADPGSPVSLALGGLLTIFVALFAVRLLLGPTVNGRDLVGELTKVGIVLTLATSWPAWRVLGYELIINGPAQIADTIGRGTGLQGNENDFVARLQNADAGLAALNEFGSGRLGVAQGDWLQLGIARDAFLVSALGSLALVRLVAAVLLALAPLVAGLLLFDVARPLFVGWTRALGFTFLGSIALTIVLSVELALLEPWLADALSKRAAAEQALNAPVEALTITIGFIAATLGALMITARIAFHPSSSRFFQLWHGGSSSQKTVGGTSSSSVSLTSTSDAVPDRAMMISQAITDGMRREERIGAPSRTPTPRLSDDAVSTKPTASTQLRGSEPLGGSWRRVTRRVSATSTRRDQTR